MKKLLNIILITVLFIPIMVNAAECDTSKVYIDSISTDQDKLKGNVIELEEATAKDKKVNLNLRMSTQDDEIIYKVVIKNDSSEDYEINKNSINLNTDYLEYSLESDNNNIVKANSTRTINLRVKYKKTVDPSKFVNGVYNDNITMKVNLRTEDTPANPNTGLPYIIILSIILLISGLSLIIFKKKRLSTLMILVGMILLPVGVKALCTCEIVIDSKVTIKTEEEAKAVLYDCDDPIEITSSYRIGMTITDYLNSTYFTSQNINFQNNVLNMLRSTNYKKYIVNNEFFNCMDEAQLDDIDNQTTFTTKTAVDLKENLINACYNKYAKELSPTDIIISKEEGAFVFRRIIPCATA